MKISRRQFGAGVAAVAMTSAAPAQDAPAPFGAAHPKLDSLCVGDWWTKKATGASAPPPMDVPRDQVVAFAVYAHDAGTLKLTAQLFPLKPGEARVARLELKRGDAWEEAARTDVLYPGWSAHFRLAGWKGDVDVPYRVRHGEAALFEGVIRRDPSDKDVIVVANMSCNSSRTTGGRPEIIERLRQHDPDLLFFAGDQTYRHTEHTAGWIEFGLQFRDILRDRPSVCIPDDHDVGHPNLWGENGRRSTRPDGADGGYFHPPEYVNLVQRQQSWHLPDPVDPAPVERGIGVYFTRLRLGGVDFAILEDRKFKSGPFGKIPKMGPRPDHINDPSYDPKSVDVPGLQMLGERQERFLREWGQDWRGARMKCVLSQTAFCGAVHMHGKRDGRLLADLDCNGWPQTPRRRALEEIRRAGAVHLCGDQHLAVVVKHGLDAWGDGPYAFTSPALVNTIYGRWWHPPDEKAGPNPLPGSPLPWTGDFVDGLGNKLSMLAYANPEEMSDEKRRADGYGLARFDKKNGTVTFECWPRFPGPQFPGWPITVKMEANDGRAPAAWLPEISVEGAMEAVVRVVEEKSGDILYTRRTSLPFQPPVFAPGRYAVTLGRERPDGPAFSAEAVEDRSSAGRRSLKL